MSEAEGFEIRVEEVEVGLVRPLRHKYLRPGQPEDAVVYDTDDDPSAVHVLVRGPEGETIGVGTMHTENRVAGQPPYRTPGERLRGLAVDGAWRRRGVAAAMTVYLTERARERGAAEVWANAREATVKLLGRQGFKRISAEFEIPTIGAHWVMAKAIKQPRKRRSEASGDDA